MVVVDTITLVLEAFFNDYITARTFVHGVNITFNGVSLV